jgi:hypothetical protein
VGSCAAETIAKAGIESYIFDASWTMPSLVAEQPRSPTPVYDPPYEESVPASAPLPSPRPLFGRGSY